VQQGSALNGVRFVYSEIETRGQDFEHLEGSTSSVTINFSRMAFRYEISYSLRNDKKLI
jgi:hypothetical protein